MHSSFYQSAHLSKTALKTLKQRHNRQGLILFGLEYGLFLFMGFLTVLFWGQVWWKWLPPLLGFGLLSTTLFAAGHETLHNTAFSSRWLNRLVCTLASASTFYTPTGFREFHFAHHRHTHEPGLDPEITFMGKPAPSTLSSLPMYLGWLSGIPILMFKFSFLLVAAFRMPAGVWDKLLPFVPKKYRNQVSWEALGVLLLHGGLLALGLWINSGFLALFLGQWIGHIGLALYVTPEHNGLPHKGNVLARTRTLLTHPLVKYLMWNMPYHAEHHAFPGIPFHALPDLHQLMKGELKQVFSGYSKFHAQALSRLLTGKKPSSPEDSAS